MPLAKTEIGEIGKSGTDGTFPNFSMHACSLRQMPRSSYNRGKILMSYSR